MNQGDVKRVIIVLGMHRSGTSAITRALGLLGVGLGEDLLPGGIDNPKGFWEDRSVLEINEQLLAYSGSSYDRLGLAWKRFEGNSKVSSLKVKATQLVSQKLNSCGGVWGFKDPRTCRLLSFWMEIFQFVGCKVGFVIALRNPASVVASLGKRNNIPAEKAYLLWLQHMLPAVLQTNGADRIVIDYDKLLGAPYEQLVRIASALDLPMPPRDTASVKEFESGFLDPQLRHTQFSLAELLLDGRAPAGVATLYQLLESVASDQEKLDSPSVNEVLAKLSADLLSISPILGYVNLLEDERIAHWRLVGERDGQIASLHQTVGERDGQLVSLKETLTERDQQLTNLSQALGERDEQLANLHQRVGERDEQIAQILSSKSWRLTKPLRAFRRSFSAGFFNIVRRNISDRSRMIWRGVPLSVHRKQKLKSYLFRRLPFLFSRSNAYQTWKSLNGGYDDGSGSDLSELEQSFCTDATYIPLLQEKPLKSKPARLICFYLPQYHPIPENNAWWGEGFTEWTNVQPATPQFAGHYQPHVPGELGYYNLLDPAVQRRQVELAKLYGIAGFCFYFYWFGGKRLLEKPIENYLNDSSLDFPFCLCWANENWSRRWDGLDSEILIAQQHSPEDDVAFIRHVSRYMFDSRYIRIGGRPLLLVYRPSLLTSAKETAQRWRDWCKNNGVGEIYLAYTQSFEALDPNQYGFDAAIEFPPNNSSPPDITNSVSSLAGGVGCTVYDWRVFVERSEKYECPDYKLFRSVCPSWDNTARRKNRGTVFLNSTPSLYQRWLKNAVRDTERRFANQDERLIFVNAWNEWAEGAHLEPDAKYGYAYLQATRNALSGDADNLSKEGRKIVLVAHDAYPHGAQLLSLNLAKTLSQGFGFHVDMICLGDGPLKAEYAKWTTLHDLTGIDARGPEAVALARGLYEAGSRAALVNTTASGYFLETLATNGIKCIALIHELRGVLDQLSLHGHAKSIATHATRIVFAAEEVATSFAEVAFADASKFVIRPQGLYKRRSKLSDRAADRKNLRQKLGLPHDSQIVLGVGYADYRKGIDLFVEAGLKMAQRIPQARWVWIGHWEESMRREVGEMLSEFPETKDRFIFPGLQTDTNLFYGGADVFALSSREDPFPSVVLEALDAEVPVVGFEGAGGVIGLLKEGCGRLVTREDAAAFADAIGDILTAPHERETWGRHGAKVIRERFSFRHYVYDLLDLVGMGMRRVSVVVPNFNYAHYLPERLSSITAQHYPVFEIIFLDDASSDHSVSVAREILEAQPIDYQIIINAANSGSVFSQWKRGVEQARGTHVWIAEADDSCSRNFLTEVVNGFEDPEIVLSYCESKQVDEDGHVLANNYLAYVADVDAKRWLYPYVNGGREEVVEALSIKNTIPNVSGVVFERRCLKSVLDENFDFICTYRVAGDWLVYVLMLKRGGIAFSPASLNRHRRHRLGVTIGNSDKHQLNEVQRVQAFVAQEFEVPQDKVEAARKYIEHLSRQFGLGVAPIAAGMKTKQ